MTWGIVAKVASVAIPAAVGYSSSKKIAEATESASQDTLQTARDAEALNRERYGEAQDYLSPFIGREAQASEQLMYEMGMGPQPEGYGGPTYAQTPAYMQSMSGYDALGQEQIAAVNQGAANAQTLYSGTRGEALAEVGAGTQLAKAGAESNFYNNYMNMLQNMATPASTTNVASLGVGQAATIGGQNIAAQNVASNYAMQGAEAQSAATADIIGGLTNAAGAYLSQPSTPPPSTPIYGGGTVPYADPNMYGGYV